jgi:Family of unknown function (DUF6152)
VIVQTRSAFGDCRAPPPQATRPDGTARPPGRLAVLAAILFTLPCSAHHSFANFEVTKTVALEGTVKEFQWTNPHCYIQLLVAGPTGTVEWSLEMNSPLAEYRVGWRPHSVKPGDKLAVVINPARNGSASGRLDSATDAAGHAFGKVPARAPAKAAP